MTDPLLPTPAPLMAACRHRPCRDSLNTVTAASGHDSANTRHFFFAPAGADIVELVVKFPGFYQGPPETDLPASCRVTAAIEYPLGKFTRLSFAGADCLTVMPGRALSPSDPLPIVIPRGGKAAVKLFLHWTGGQVDFPLTSYAINCLDGEWLSIGSELADQTLSASAQTNSYPDPPYAGVGIGCAIYARTSGRVPVLGILGDSISMGTGDNSDPVWGGASVERGLRAQIPIINVACQAENFRTYFSRTAGRAALLAGAITHLLVGLGRNDISSGRPQTQVASDLQEAIAPFLTQGVKVYAVTVTPRSLSTDNWATTENQTIHVPHQELVRLKYNAWLRQNWPAIGLSGIFDWAHAVDPHDTGLWLADGTRGNASLGVATLGNDSIASVALPVFSRGTAYGGRSYPANQAKHPCVVHRYPDDPIRSGDAVVTCATDAQGVVIAFAVVDGGRYGIPPMVTPAGPLTADGTHPTGRGYNAMIAATGFGLQAFTL
jgi:lysophospholipase L1-like esterase